MYYPTLKTQSMTEIIDKLDFHKIKNSCPGKDNDKRIRRQATYWEKILQKILQSDIAKDISDKRLLYKKLLKLSYKKTNNPT